MSVVHYGGEYTRSLLWQPLVREGYLGLKQVCLQP